MNLKFTEPMFHVKEQCLHADGMNPARELTDEDLGQVYGGNGHGEDMEGMTKTTREHRSGGDNGYSLRFHLYGSHYWSHMYRTTHWGHDED